MLCLHASTQSLTAKLSGADTSAEPTVLVHYRTVPIGTQQGLNPFATPQVQPTTMNGATPVTILPAPPSGYGYYIDNITVTNDDTAAATVTITFVDSNGSVSDPFIPALTLQVNEFASYENGAGWSVTTTSGAVKTSAVFTSPVAGSILSSSPTAGVGYSTGAGASVTQITSATTGVTINTVSGQITTVTQNFAHGTAVQFTVTDSAVGIHDTVIVNIQSGSNSGNTIATVPTVAAGSFAILLSNLGLATAETGAIILNFNVVKGVIS